MIYFNELESSEHFKKCIADIGDQDVANISTMVYCCQALFKFKYVDISHWIKGSSNKTDWFNYLRTLEQEILLKEIHHELPFGTSKGVYISRLFYKEVASNDDENAIQTLSDYMAMFNQLGFQILNNSFEPRGTFKRKNAESTLEASMQYESFH